MLINELEPFDVFTHAGQPERVYMMLAYRWHCEKSHYVYHACVQLDGPHPGRPQYIAEMCRVTKRIPFVLFMLNNWNKHPMFTTTEPPIENSKGGTSHGRQEEQQGSEVRTSDETRHEVSTSSGT